jgi:hypothetical protein
MWSHVTPETDMPPINKIWTLLEKDQRIHQASDFLCHAILDMLVDITCHCSSEWKTSRSIGKPVLAKPGLKRLKHSVIETSIMVLRHIIRPQREIVERLSRANSP